MRGMCNSAMQICSEIAYRWANKKNVNLITVILHLLIYARYSDLIFLLCSTTKFQQDIFIIQFDAMIIVSRTNVVTCILIDGKGRNTLTISS